MSEIVVRAGETLNVRIEPGAQVRYHGDRDALAAQIMAALEQPSMAGYRLPKEPSDLAYAVADAVLALPATPAETGLREALAALIGHADETSDGTIRVHGELLRSLRTALSVEERP